MYVLAVASSAKVSLYRPVEQLRAALLLCPWLCLFSPPNRHSSGSRFSLLGEEHLPAPNMKPFSDLVPDLSLSLGWDVSNVIKQNISTNEES